MQQVLTATQTTGDAFGMAGGWQLVMVEPHQGGVWALQSQSPNGVWIDTDITFSARGEKAVLTTPSHAYRFHGGTVGAKAYATGVYEV